MTTVTKAGGAVLPVVAWKHSMNINSFVSDYAKTMNSAQEWPMHYSIGLTPHAPAQATIDELRAEVIALKSKQIDVEAVMRLAEVYAKASSELDESIRSRSRAPRMVNRHDLRVHVAFKAAREALRAFLLGDGGTL